MGEVEQPQDIDAERSVLAAMLLDGAGRASELLDAGSFYRLAHGQIFDALVALWRDGIPADLITAANELGRRGNLAAAGGVEYLAGLLDYATTAANLEAHARIVAEKAALRKLIKAADNIRAQAGAFNAESCALLESAEAELATVARGNRRSTSLLEGLRMFTSPAKADERPDPILGDGLICRGDLVVLAGKPGLGKSRLALELAVAAEAGATWMGIPTQQCRVGYIGAEFTRYRWWRRCVRLFGDGMAPDDPAALQAAYGRLPMGQLAVITRDQVDALPDLATDAGATALEQLITSRGLRLLILDPLSRFLGDREETNETFAAMVNRLDRVRTRTGCAILLVHHERKGMGERAGAKEDDLDALRGGTVLPAAAVTIMRLVGGHGGLKALKFIKANHADQPAEIWHRIPDGGGPTVMELTPGEKAEANRDRIAAWVVAQSSAVTSRAAAEATGLSLRTTKTHLLALAEAGAVARDDRNARETLWSAPQREDGRHASILRELLGDA